jgi:glucans biosynthesis protein C
LRPLTGGIEMAALPRTPENLTRTEPRAALQRQQHRLSYFDWLRAIAVLGVVAYHTLQPFGSIGWFISNVEISPVLTMMILTLASFGLPVLFLISGASARFALQTRSRRAFLAERARRLLVPFALGAIVFGPINGYTIGVFNGTASQSFLEYLITYPGIVIDFQVHNFGLSRFLFLAVHLWFLGALFLYSAAALPIFAFLSSTRGRFFIESLTRAARWPASTLLLAVPATIPIYLLFASTLQPQLWDSWSLGWFAVVFLIGYVVYSDDRLVAAVHRDLVPALGVGALGTVGLALAGYAEWAAVPQQYGTTYFLMLSIFGVTGWAWTLALLGVAMRVAAWQRPLAARVREAALPLYILHVPLVTTISFFVVRSSLDFWPKVLVNVILGVSVSVLVAAAATRIAPLRPLLGVRSASPTAARATRAVAAAGRA